VFMRAEFPWLLAIFVWFLGICWGSFLNVVIYRTPRGLSVVKPRSFCPSSGKPIPWYDNIPIISWLILRGRSRFDGSPISFRYPLVEMITGLLFVACWLWLPLEVAIVGWIFVCLMIAATFIDLEHMILPDAFTIGGMVIGVILSFALPELHGYGRGNLFFIESMRSGISSFIGVFIGSGVILWISVVAETILKREAMGFGDVLFMGCIGAFCGWQGALFAIFGGALIGTIVIIPLMLIQAIRGKMGVTTGRVENRIQETESKSDATTHDDGRSSDQRLGVGTAVPFGPWLAVAAILYYIGLRYPVNQYFGNFKDVLYTEVIAKFSQ